MRVLIIEDEPAAAKRLSNMLLVIDPRVELAGPLESVEESADWLMRNEPADLILMDIHLTDGSSLELFDLVDIQTPVIFTTAFDQYAVNAFKLNAVDYLLKPIKKLELQEAIQKYQNRKGASQPLTAVVQSFKERDKPDKKVLVKFGNTFRVLNLAMARYFYSDQKLTMMISSEDKRIPIEYSLDMLEKELNPAQFYRISRQVLVNRKAIGDIHIYSKTRLKIQLKPTGRVDAIVSKEKVPRFKKWLVEE